MNPANDDENEIARQGRGLRVHVHKQLLNVEGETVHRAIPVFGRVCLEGREEHGENLYKVWGLGSCVCLKGRGFLAIKVKTCSSVCGSGGGSRVW